MFISIQTTEDDKLQVGASPSLDFNTALQMLHTLNLHMLKAFADIYEKEIHSLNAKAQVKKPTKDGNHASSALSPKELKEAVYQSRLQIYDSFNIACSSILELFMPEANDYKEDITAEAIKEVELSILQKKIAELKETKPENYKANLERYDKLKERITNAKQNMPKV